MKITEAAPGLYLLPLDQEITGFQSFVSAWLFQGENVTFLVDPGPAATVPDLVRGLEALSVKSLDCILLTHIHIDHAGGTGDLLDRYPDTPVVLHASGIKHMADPARLWEGSLKTLGDTARAYGPIRPVPEKLLMDVEGFSEHGIRSILTPGHAQHHVSYLYDSILFAGEAGGIRPDTDEGGRYLRPATPPRFIYEITMESLDRLLATPHEILCYGHFGATRDTPHLLKTQKHQLGRWREIITSVMAETPNEDVLQAAFRRLLAEDPLLQAFHGLSPDVTQREEGFLMNSIRGFTGYLADKKKKES